MGVRIPVEVSVKKSGGGYSNVIVIDQENQGVSAARNEGLKRATGKYIMFVDSDDWCEADMVAKLVQVIDDCDFAYCSYYLDTDKTSKTIKNAVANGRYTIEEIYKPLFFGSKNVVGADMATALWRGIFKTQIIKENSIEFDIYIRFAEDWLFYADYFKYVKSITLIDFPLYHYYQRNNSVMHVYNPASKLGVQKSCYILDKFFKTASQTEIDATLYEPNMAKRYVGLILNQAKNVWNKKNPLRVKEKYKFIAWAIKEANISDTLKKIQYVDFEKTEQLMLWAIRHNNIFFLSVYGICYNIMRDLRNGIRRMKIWE